MHIKILLKVHEAMFCDLSVKIYLEFLFFILTWWLLQYITDPSLRCWNVCTRALGDISNQCLFISNQCSFILCPLQLLLDMAYRVLVKWPLPGACPRPLTCRAWNPRTEETIQTWLSCPKTEQDGRTSRNNQIKRGRSLYLCASYKLLCTMCMCKIWGVIIKFRMRVQ